MGDKTIGREPGASALRADTERIAAMSEMIGRSRLHVPGKQDPNAPPPTGSIVIKGPNGEPMSLPVVYVGAIDDQAAQQIRAIVRKEVVEVIGAMVQGIAGNVMQAFMPPPQAAPPGEEGATADDTLGGITSHKDEEAAAAVAAADG